MCIRYCEEKVWKEESAVKKEMYDTKLLWVNTRQECQNRNNNWHYWKAGIWFKKCHSDLNKEMNGSPFKMKLNYNFFKWQYMSRVFKSLNSTKYKKASKSSQNWFFMFKIIITQGNYCFISWQRSWCHNIDGPYAVPSNLTIAQLCVS